MKFNIGKKKKLTSIYELPDEYWKMLEESGMEHPSEMWEIELIVTPEEGDPPIPDDLLGTLYKNAIESQDFEEANEIKIELESRGYTITIEETEKNKGIIRFDKKNE